MKVKRCGSGFHFWRFWQHFSRGQPACLTTNPTVVMVEVKRDYIQPGQAFCTQASAGRRGAAACPCSGCTSATSNLNQLSVCKQAQEGAVRRCVYALVVHLPHNKSYSGNGGGQERLHTTSASLLHASKRRKARCSGVSMLCRKQTRLS